VYTPIRLQRKRLNLSFLFKEKNMRKLALGLVLCGAMAVVGCGSEPAKPADANATTAAPAAAPAAATTPDAAAPAAVAPDAAPADAPAADAPAAPAADVPTTDAPTADAPTAPAPDAAPAVPETPAPTGN